MQLLEERNNSLIIMEDDRKLRVVEKNPYTELKYKFFQGKRIRFVATEGESRASVQEEETDGIFECKFNDSSVRIENSKIEIARAVQEVHKSGRLSSILTLWKIRYAELFIGMTIRFGGTGSVEFSPQGSLSIPSSVKLEILEWINRCDGGRVVKAIFGRREASGSTDRIFTHEVPRKGTTRRIIVNEIAVALIGRDETHQYWMHIVPPEYRDRSMSLCELWLAGGEYGRDELID